MLMIRVAAGSVKGLQSHVGQNVLGYRIHNFESGKMQYIPDALSKE